MQDPIQIRNKIISLFKSRGPSLPVHIAKEVNMDILFTSAFLSELVSEKTLKISYMKVGGTPVYLMPGQEPSLEKFSQYLKSKEKDAFFILKDKKIVKDSEQDPAIRVALRAIRDFAIPFKKNDEIYWRYLTIPESDFEEKKVVLQTPPKKITTTLITKKISEQIKPIPSKEETPKQKELNIFEKSAPRNILPNTPKSTGEGKKKITKRKTQEKKNDKFFNNVKEFLSNKTIEILDIQDFSKKEITLIIKENGEEKVLIAYDKKKIDENDLIKASQKASKLKLRYILLSRGEPLKKTLNFIEATKNLNRLEKLE